MRLPFGHLLTVEVRHLFEEMDIVKDERSVRSDCQ